MDTHFDTEHPQAGATPDREAARTAAIKDATLDDLARMRRVGMNFIERLDARAAGGMTEAELEGMKRVGDDCIAFERVARAVRQIVALEHETVGIRPMPRYRDAGRGGGTGAPGDADDDTEDEEERMWRDTARNALRTRSTRGVQNDLKDRPDRKQAAKDRAAEDAIINPAKDRMLRHMNRILDAAEADLEAAGTLAEAKRGSPWERVTVYIHRVPHPRFTALLEEMAGDPDGAIFAALVRKHAKHRPPFEQPPPQAPPEPEPDAAGTRRRRGAG
jgi:hypothetical protein